MKFILQRIKAGGVFNYKCDVYNGQVTTPTQFRSVAYMFMRCLLPRDPTYIAVEWLAFWKVLILILGPEVLQNGLRILVIFLNPGIKYMGFSNI
jgi:hypothetical protein